MNTSKPLRLTKESYNQIYLTVKTYWDNHDPENLEGHKFGLECVRSLKQNQICFALYRAFENDPLGYVKSNPQLKRLNESINYLKDNECCQNFFNKTWDF